MNTSSSFERKSLCTPPTGENPKKLNPIDGELTTRGGSGCAVVVFGRRTAGA
jgi:hypothetical protein